ncbi:MAG: hypothetical protein KF842_09915 [Caulobacter sp.]|nr:hypothetical protein [Caulobacter sp.]
MASFSATDAGLVGFKLAREYPRVVPVWAVLALLNMVLSVGIMTSLAGPALVEFQQMGANASSANPEDVLRLYARLGPAYGLMILVSMVFSGVMNAAAARMVLRPADQGLAFLKLGADELRQIWLAILVILIMFAALLVVSLAMGVLVGLGSAVHPAVGGLLAVLGVFAAIGLFIALAVRLSLAAPITFATGRIGIAASFRETRGHFWNLVGAFLLAGVMAMIVSILGLAIVSGVIAAGFGLKGLGSIFAPDFSSFATLLSPPMIIYYLLMAVISALTYLIILCPGPTIYKALTSAPDVFD